MNAILKSPVGDYDLRGPDYATLLAGPLLSTHIDADRIVREGRGFRDCGWSNGFPNWELYRCAYAGDPMYTRQLRDWVCAFAIAHCLAGGIRQDAFSEELACFAGNDALFMLIHCEEMQPYTVSAIELGVHHKTYKRLRDQIAKRLHESLKEYMMRLEIGFRIAIIEERKCGLAISNDILKVRESHLSAEDIAGSSSGNFIVSKSADSDDL